MAVDFIAMTAVSSQSPHTLPTRLRRRSSSLFALDTLSPPSPPLSPSVSITFCKESGLFGEIPIIFDFLTTSSAPCEERLSKMACLKPPLPPLAKFSPMSAFFPMSSSADTLDTISTQAFGGARPDSCYSSDQRYSILSGSSTLDSPIDAHFEVPSPTTPMGTSSNIPCHDLLAPSESTPGVQVLDYDSGQKNMSHFTISAYLASPSVYGDVSGTIQSSESATASRTLEVSSLQNSSPDELWKDQDWNDTGLSTIRHAVKGASKVSTLSNSQSLSIVQFAAMPTASSGSSDSAQSSPRTPGSDDKTPTQATFLKRHAQMQQPLSRQTSLQNLRSDAPSIRTSSSASEINVHFRYPLLGQKRRPASTCILDKENVSGDDRLVVNEVVDVISPTRPAIPLPAPCLKHAQWLRDTTVEIWIDQEGFRAIRPKFYLASISNGLPYAQDQCASRGAENDPLLTTVAEFLPISRAAHFFHHAALDRAPTLNRIITNGDETHDYIARTARLVLRDNGVFFVHGTEDHRLPGGCVVRLNWRFEYFVSSRRPDGRSAHRGEKVFTPLSFSCTPALLDRARANKVKVLHIMKKTLLPNLVAQKLEPPDLPLPVPSTPTLAASPSSGSLRSITISESRSSVASQKSNKSIFSKSPRTGRGSAFESAPAPTHSLPPSMRTVPSRTRHRRGSHSETTTEDFLRRRDSEERRTRHERSRSDEAARYLPGIYVDGAPESFPPPHDATLPLIRPIIPRGDLLKMFDSEVPVKRRPSSVRLEVVNNMQMTVLPAPPRPKQPGF